MSKPSGTARRPWFKRWYMLVIYVLVLMTGGLCLLFAFGIAQPYVVRYAIAKGLGAYLTVSGVSLIDRVEIDQLALYDEGGEAAVLRIEGLDLDYWLRPRNGRYLSSLDVVSLDVNLDGRDAADTNYDFLIRLLTAPSTGVDPVPFIPRTTRIENLRFSVSMPELEAILDGIHLEAEVDSLEEFEIKVSGASVQTMIDSKAAGVARKVDNGTLELYFSLRNGTFNVKSLIELPEVLRLEGRAAVQTSGGLRIDADLHSFEMNQLDLSSVDPRLFPAPLSVESLKLEGARMNTTTETPGGATFLAVKIPSLEVTDLDLSGLAPHLLPTPVRLGRVVLTDARLTVPLAPEDLSLPDASLNLDVESLSVGETDHELYNGDLHLALEAVADESRLDARTRLSKGQELVFKAQGDLEKATASVALEGWDFEDILDVIPKDYRAPFEEMTHLKRADVKVDVAWARPAYEVSMDLLARVTTEQGVEEAPAMNVTASGSVDVGDGLPERIQFDMRLGDESVEGDVSLESLDSIAATVNLYGVNPDRWARAFANVAYLGDITTSITGGLKAEGSTSTMNGTFSLNLTAAPFAYGDLGLPADETLHVVGTGKVGGEGKDAKSGELWFSGDSLDLSVGELASVAVKDWSLEALNMEGAAAVSGEVDLDLIAMMFGLDDFWGLVTFKSDVSIADGIVADRNLSATAETFGYGDFILPWGTNTTVSAEEVTFDAASGRVSAQGLKLTAEPGLLASSEKLSLLLSPFTLEAPFIIETDLTLLVEMGYLDSVSSKMQVSGCLAISEESTRGVIDVDMSTASLILPEALAAVTDALIKAHVVYTDGSFDGSGSLTITNLVAVGASVSDVDVTFGFEQDTLKVTKFAASIMDGTLQGRGQVRPMAKNMPAKLELELTDIDLETFTRVMQPPDVTMTGKMSGTVAFTGSLEKIDELRADLRVTQDFTLNRDMVKQILLSGYLTGYTGKMLDKVIKKVLGEAEQVPFADVRMHVEFVEGQIEGEVKLRGDQLDLTIDLNVDPGALAEALKLRQQMQMEELADVSFQ